MTDEIAGDAAESAPPAAPIELTAPIDAAQLEGLLFVAERPLSRGELARLAGTDPETIDALLGDLEVDLRRRGIRLVVADDRVELATAPEAGPIIARYLGTETARLSASALETLAIIAWRQPVTRGVIERIRGVDSEGVLRSLLHRRLIAEQGRAETPGRPFLYGTTFEFLERFGLLSLEDLPVLEASIAGRLAEPGEDEPGEDEGGEGQGGATVQGSAAAALPDPGDAADLDG